MIPDLRAAIDAAERRAHGERNWQGLLTEGEIGAIYREATQAARLQVGRLAQENQRPLNVDEVTYVYAALAAITAAKHIRVVYYEPMLRTLGASIQRVRTSIEGLVESTDESVNLNRDLASFVKKTLPYLPHDLHEQAMRMIERMESL